MLTPQAVFLLEREQTNKQADIQTDTGLQTWPNALPTPAAIQSEWVTNTIRSKTTEKIAIQRPDSGIGYCYMYIRFVVWDGSCHGVCCGRFVQCNSTRNYVTDQMSLRRESTVDVCAVDGNLPQTRISIFLAQSISYHVIIIIVIILLTSLPHWIKYSHL